jgi:DNA-binding transcriptional MerR regulator
MQVGEVASRTGVSVRSIRHYERSGLLRARRRTNGYREFDEESVDRVRVIRDLIATGFTVDEIQTLNECLSPVTSSSRCKTQTATLYREKLKKIAEQVRTLMLVKRRIEERLSTLE